MDAIHKQSDTRVKSGYVVLFLAKTSLHGAFARSSSNLSPTAIPTLSSNSKQPGNYSYIDVIPFPANMSETAEIMVLVMSWYYMQWSVWCPMFSCFHVFTFSCSHGTFIFRISVKRYSSFDSGRSPQASCIGRLIDLAVSCNEHIFHSQTL
jgi:hypothetical protein